MQHPTTCVDKLSYLICWVSCNSSSNNLQDDLESWRPWPADSSVGSSGLCGERAACEVKCFATGAYTLAFLDFSLPNSQGSLPSQADNVHFLLLEHGLGNGIGDWQLSLFPSNLRKSQ